MRRRDVILASGATLLATQSKSNRRKVALILQNPITHNKNHIYNSFVSYATFQGVDIWVNNQLPTNLDEYDLLIFEPATAGLISHTRNQALVRDVSINSDLVKSYTIQSFQYGYIIGHFMSILPTQGDIFMYGDRNELHDRMVANGAALAAENNGRSLVMSNNINHFLERKFSYIIANYLSLNTYDRLLRTSPGLFIGMTKRTNFRRVVINTEYRLSDFFMNQLIAFDNQKKMLNLEDISLSVNMRGVPLRIIHNTQDVYEKILSKELPIGVGPLSVNGNIYINENQSLESLDFDSTINMPLLDKVQVL